MQVSDYRCKAVNAKKKFQCAHAVFLSHIHKGHKAYNVSPQLSEKIF